jgi:ribose/xylose/arabinose/galactoside ABC-type transport system permease subunit
MRTLFIIPIVMMLTIALFNCSSHRVLSKDNPEAGASAKIVMTSGKIMEGVLLVVQGDTLKYIDSKSHRPETLLLSTIKEIKSSSSIYDLEGNKITEADISNAKSSSKIVTYAVGGTAFGAAVGLGIGLILVHNYDIPIIYPMATMGAVGGILFGIKGNRTAYDDAVESVREERYQKMQIKMRQELESEKKRLEEERAKEQQKLKELKEKGK